MQTHYAHRIIAAVLCLCTLLSVCTFPAVAASGWTPTETSSIYVATDDLSGLSDEDFRHLENTVTLVAAEFNAKLEEKRNVVYNIAVKFGRESSAGNHDLIVRMLPRSSDDLEKAEAYLIKVGTANTVVEAYDCSGVMYGLRRVLKQLLTDEFVSDVALNKPDVSERAVSLDNGRKYFTPDWIKQLIREMSWNNMNTLVLHFSEEMGLGIQSVKYPWLHGRYGYLCTQTEYDPNNITWSNIPSDNRVLTQDEVRDIIAYAKLYNVEIIPSLDTPGHMNYIVRKFYEKSAQGEFSFTLGTTTYTVPQGSNISNYYEYNGNKDYIVAGSGNPNYSRGIDITNDIAVAFTKSLIEEYAQLFHDAGCTKIDLGGDELLGWGARPPYSGSVSRWQQLDHWKRYAVNKTGNSNAVAYDAFILYMNDMNEFVRDKGYTSVRMWNDNAYLTTGTGWTGVAKLDSNIDVWYWLDGRDPSTYTSNGHKVYNIIGDYTYYVLTDAYFSSDRENNSSKDFYKAYADIIYAEWSPFRFSAQNELIHNNELVSGGAMGIWCDNPTLREEDALMAEMLPMLRSIAVKSWDSSIHESVNFNTFTNYVVNMIGSAPDVSIDTSVSRLPDNSQLLTLIAEFDEYKQIQARESKWSPLMFSNYETVVEEARKYMTNAAQLVMYSETQVSTMVSTIESARDIMIGAADPEHMPPCDVSCADPVRKLIDEYYKTYLPQNEVDPYVPKAWRDYESLVLVAKELVDQGLYEPNWVACMVTDITEVRNELIYSASIAQPLIALIDEFETVYVPKHAETPYMLDKWLLYVKQIEYARYFINNELYTPEDIAREVANVEQARDALVEQNYTFDGLLGAGFMTSTIRRGYRPVLIVHTKRDVNFTKDMIILYKNGSSVPFADSSITVREMSYNSQKPDVRSFIITLPVQTTAGTFTYRVYGCIPANNELGLLFTTDYYDCTIIVR